MDLSIEWMIDSHLEYCEVTLDEKENHLDAMRLILGRNKESIVEWEWAKSYRVAELTEGNENGNMNAIFKNECNL